MLKALCVHAHFDDFEFVAAGTFARWRHQLGDGFHGRLLVCTDGQAGHHQRPREETGDLRWQEQLASAKLAGLEARRLHLPDGSLGREACLQVDHLLLAALWKEVRDFAPDVLFCPPLPTDPLAGVHVDHLAVADAVRKVAYMINVPHAFSPEFPPADPDAPATPVKTPVILNTYDAYLTGSNAFDLAVDVEPDFDLVARMTYCHQSQISEWLPWVARHHITAPTSLDDWKTTLRQRFDRQNLSLGLPTGRAIETFRVTAWGEVPTLDTLLDLFPPLVPDTTDHTALATRLDRWRLA